MENCVEDTKNLETLNFKHSSNRFLDIDVERISAMYMLCTVRPVTFCPRLKRTRLENHHSQDNDVYNVVKSMP